MRFVGGMNDLYRLIGLPVYTEDGKHLGRISEILGDRRQ